MNAYFIKIISLVVFFCMVVQKGNAQSSLSNDEMLAFNFKTASTNLLTSENLLKTMYDVPSENAVKTGEKTKMSRTKKFKIVGAVLVSVGTVILAGTITGGVIYGKKTFGQTSNSGSSKASIKEIVRFSGLVFAGTVSSNALIGTGGWMIADGGN